MNRFLKAIHGKNEGTPPIWFMRQAGRYHSHYQKLRARHSFIDLCKKPELASEVTRGPIEEFDFDAAILFSDLLFPLEALGMGLRYEPGPKMGWKLKTSADLKKLDARGEKLASQLEFQGEALRKIRSWLPKEKGLIGFVGAPLTLYYYAVEGSHQASKEIPIPPQENARAGFTDGRFQGFNECLAPLLAENLRIQADAGADVIAFFDTCGGEVSVSEFREHAWPALKEVLTLFRKTHPSIPLIYYSRGTGPEYWNVIEPSLIRCLGVDWNTPIDQALKQVTPKFALQGNFDPEAMTFPESEMNAKLEQYLKLAKSAPAETRRSWISGLGHGVTPTVPEKNVKLFIKRFREMFA